MLKTAFASSLMLAASLTFAGDFQCQVNKKTFYEYSCVQCAQRNGDNDCVREITTTCLGTKETNVLKATKMVSASDIFISGQNREAQFILSQAASGHSYRLTYPVDGSEVTFGSSSHIDLDRANFEVELKTKAPARSGSVVALKLQCKSL